MRVRPVRSASRRPGYTLLEVILAIAIGLLIVAALYVALDVQIRYMHAGRNAVVEAQLARGLLTRITADIKLSMAMLPTDPSVAGRGSSGGGRGGRPGSSGGPGGGSGSGPGRGSGDGALARVGGWGSARGGGARGAAVRTIPRPGRSTSESRATTRR